MIVDDSLFMRNVLRGVLKDRGYEVVAEAGSGIEAMRILHDRKPALIMLDIILPDANGIDLISSIRAVCPEARVVICSSLGQDAVGKKALDHGASAFIQKPFRPEQVFEVLDALEK
jgi:two-component system chemotaxis response regulator CheY